MKPTVNDGTTTSGTQPQKNMTTMGKIDTSDLMMIIRWIINVSYRSPKLEWAGLIHDIGNHSHDDVIKWKHFPRNWPFVREIHRSPVNFPHKGQWRGALMFSLMYAWINDWVNNREAGDLRLQHGHYDVIVMRPVAQFVSAVGKKCYGNLRCNDLEIGDFSRMS